MLHLLAGGYQIKLINYTAGCYIKYIIITAGVLGWASSVQREWRPRNGVSISLILQLNQKKNNNKRFLLLLLLYIYFYK